MNRSIPPPAPGLHPIMRRPLAVPTAISPGKRAADLFAEAQQHASAQLDDFAARAAALAEMAVEIGEGGEVYPAGVREEAKRLATTLDQSCKSVEVIRQRAER